MEEIEVPTEHLQETIKEKAEEALKGKENAWSLYVAISTALIAVLAAISGLLAGHHSNEALIEQIKASDQWAFYQAKGIKAEIKTLQTGNESEKLATISRYKREQEEIKKEAEGAQQASIIHLQKHVTLARSVTLFQIAIAVAAISMLTRKKSLWYISLLLALTGIFFFVSGLM